MVVVQGCRVSVGGWWWFRVVGICGVVVVQGCRVSVGWWWWFRVVGYLCGGGGSGL